MHIDIYVIKHHNKFQRMGKESYLNIFAKRRLRADTDADADAWVIALALWD